MGMFSNENWYFPRDVATFFPYVAFSLLFVCVCVWERGTTSKQIIPCPIWSECNKKKGKVSIEKENLSLKVSAI